MGKNIYKRKEELLLKPKLQLSFVIWLCKRKKKNVIVQDCRINVLFPVLWEVLAVVCLLPVKQNAHSKVLCHITLQHINEQEVIIRYSFDLFCYPRNNYWDETTIEMDLLPKKKELKNECHQAKEQTPMQDHCSSAKGSEKYLAPSLVIASGTGLCLHCGAVPDTCPELVSVP